MLSIRRANERGAADHGWLDTRHSFSFADYFDPRHMGHGALRVLNEDRVQPGKGFGRHGHRDMEIISVVLSGSLAHEDSMGTGSVITRGDVQRMSAGTGVLHSEFNASATELVHFLQIWLVPDRTGLSPSYEQRRFERAFDGDGLVVVASPDGREGSLTVHADATLHMGTVRPGAATELAVQPGRSMYVHVATGSARVNGELLGAGDAVYVTEVPAVRLEGAGEGGAHVLVFDLA